MSSAGPVQRQCASSVRIYQRTVANNSIQLLFNKGFQLTMECCYNISASYIFLTTASSASAKRYNYAAKLPIIYGLGCSN